MNKPVNYILNIGIDKYTDVQELNGNVDSLKKVSQVLVSKYKFEDEYVVHLYDSDATKTKIYEKFKDLARISNLGNLIIFFSGHGDMKHLQPYNSISNDESSWIPHSEVLRLIEGIEAQHIFLIIDACNSGNLLTESSIKLSVGEPGLERSRVVFTSSYGRQTTPNNNNFMSSIITFLDENQSENVVFSDSLSISVKAKINKIDADNLPRYGSICGDETGRFPLYLKFDEEHLWKKAQENNTIESYEEYLRFYKKYEIIAKERKKNKLRN